MIEQHQFAPTEVTPRTKFISPSLAEGQAQRCEACLTPECQSDDAGTRQTLKMSLKTHEMTFSPEISERRDQAGVMLVERRGQVIAVGSEPTGNRRSSNSRRKAAAFDRAPKDRQRKPTTDRERTQPNVLKIADHSS
jgi:hypothetical protein